jgi:hypothetical protein
MKLLIAAALLVAPAFADCCTYQRVRAEASRARHEAQRYRADTMREARRYRTELLRETARARAAARQAARDAYRNSYRDRRWYF